MNTVTQNNCITAEVMSLNGDMACVRFLKNTEEREAHFAFSAPLQLTPGDKVLCMIADADEVYMIAPIGRIQQWTVQAEKIQLEAQKMELKAARMEFSAQRLLEKTKDAYRWTSNLLQWCCGRQRTLIEGQQQIRAGRIDQKAEGPIRIDGETINLG